MLKPKELEVIPQALTELYSQVEDDIIANMAERMAEMPFIPAAEWQYQKLHEMGLLRSDIVERLSKASGIAKKEIEALTAQTASKALKADAAVYKAGGIPADKIERASEAVKSVLIAGLDNTKGLFDNITRTTADTATRQFERALDRAWLQVSSGAIDYNSAIRRAVKSLAKDGVAAIEYPSGHRDHLDVAVRRAVLTGLNQTSLRAQDRLAEQLGSDLVEVTAHAGARTGDGWADHAEWQGKIYSRSGKHDKFPGLFQSTGYGTGEGLGGWNCRHNYYPYIDGMEPKYSEEELKELNEPKFQLDGDKLTEYEVTQKQREAERNVRRWKREYSAQKAAGESTEESERKLDEWQARARDISAQTGLKRQPEREFTAGFKRKTLSEKKADAIKKTVEEAKKKDEAAKKKAQEKEAKAKVKAEEKKKAAHQKRTEKQSLQTKQVFQSIEGHELRVLSGEGKTTAKTTGTTGHPEKVLIESTLKAYPDGQEQIELIKDYTGKGYENLHKRPDDIEKLNEAIDRLAPLHWSEGDLYRGMGIPREVFDILEQGDIIDFKKPTSWTERPDLAEHFAKAKTYQDVKVVFIDETQGSRSAIGIKNISKYSTESEILYSGKVGWRVKEVKYTPHFIQTNSLYEVRVEQVRLR